MNKLNFIFSIFIFFVFFGNANFVNAKEMSCIVDSTHSEAPSSGAEYKLILLSLTDLSGTAQISVRNENTNTFKNLKGSAEFFISGQNGIDDLVVIWKNSSVNPKFKKGQCFVWSSMKRFLIGENRLIETQVLQRNPALPKDKCPTPAPPKPFNYTMNCVSESD